MNTEMSTRVEVSRKIIKYSYAFIFSLFCLFFLIAINKIQIANPNPAWVQGDWLINYSNGFVRRGLLGEISRLISTYLNHDLLSTVNKIKLIFYFTFTACVIYLSILKKIGFFEIVLWLSPTVFIFSLNDPEGSGRKEILLFAMFALYATLDTITQSTPKSIIANWKFWYQLVGFIFLTLAHEGLFFFYQYFLFYEMVKKSTLSRIDFASFSVAWFASVFLIILIALQYKGDSIYTTAICNSLYPYDLNQEICNGSISALAGFEFIITPGFYKTYLFAGFASFTPLLIYGILQKSTRDEKVKIVFYFFAFWILSLPIYYMGADWGRWIHITSTLLTTLFIANKTTANLRLKMTGLLGSLCFLIASWFFIFSWALPHWIPPSSNQFIHHQNIKGWINNF
jgi:hypothetical protein